MIRLHHRRYFHGGTIALAAVLVGVSFFTAISARGAGVLTVTGLNVALGFPSERLTFSFRATSPVASTGQGVHLDIPQEFTGQSAIGMDDVDFEIGGADLTLVASCLLSTDIRFVKTDLTSAGGVWRYSFLACGANAVAPGETIAMRMGTGATYQALGANRLVTPATSGMFTFSVTGQAGSFDKVLGLGGPGQGVTGYVNISATVQATEESDPGSTPSPSGGGGGGGGGGGLPSGPTGISVSDVAVEIVDAQTAKVTWKTSASATSEVNYGITPTLGRHKANVNYVSEHMVTLNGLIPGQTYYYQVLGRDASSNSYAGQILSFAMPAMEALVISDLQVVDISETSATVVFYTNRPARYVLDYGPGDLTQSMSGDGYATSFRIPLKSLSANRLYVLRVSAADDKGTQSDEARVSFMTLAYALPSGVLGFSGTRSLANGITLYWTPPSLAYKEIRLYRYEGYHISSEDGEGLLLYVGREMTYLDTTVVRTVDYTYCVEVVDSDESVSSRQCLPFAVDEGTRVTVRAIPEKRTSSKHGQESRVLSVIRTEAETAPHQRASLMLDATGQTSYTLLQSVMGPAKVGLKGISHLRRTEATLNLSAQESRFVDFSKGGLQTLIAGDIYQSEENLLYAMQDDHVNVLDLSVLIRHLSTPDVISDLDRDDLVTALDLSLLIRNLNRSGEVL